MTKFQPTTTTISGPNAVQQTIHFMTYLIMLEYRYKPLESHCVPYMNWHVVCQEVHLKSYEKLNLLIGVIYHL